MRTHWLSGAVKGLTRGEEFFAIPISVSGRAAGAAALAIKAVLRIAFRQTQGLIQSLSAIMKMDIHVPGYSQFCRRRARLNPFSAPLNHQIPRLNRFIWQ